MRGHQLDVRHRWLALAAAVIVAGCSQQEGESPSFDAQAWVTHYQRIAANRGFDLTYGELEAVHQTGFVLRDVSVIRHGVEEPIKIKSLTIEDPVELDGDGLAAQAVEVEGLSWVGRDRRRRETTATVASFTAHGLYLPDQADVNAPLFLYNDPQFALDDLRITVDGEAVISVAEFDGAFRVSEDETRVAGGGSMGGLEIDTAAIEDGRLRRQLADLGYERLSLDAELAGSWDLQAGRIELDRYELAMTDAGALTLTFALTGYGRDKIDRLRTINARIAALPADERVAATDEANAELADIALERFSLSWRDESLANRILDLQTRASGLSREQLVAIARQLIGSSHSKLLSADLSKAMAAAVGEFLTDPKSITVSGIPDEPVPVSEIAELALALPALLFGKLNVTVRANENQ